MCPENAQEEASLLGREPSPALVQQAHTRLFTRPDKSSRTIAFKFGGSSLLGATRMLHAANLVRHAAQDARVVVVVSAMKGITDQLLSIAHQCEAGRFGAASTAARELIRAHQSVLRDLQAAEDDYERVLRELNSLGNDLLHDTSGREPSLAGAELHDRIASYGERFSARLFAAALDAVGTSAVPVASSDFVLTCDTFRDASPEMEETRRRGSELLFPLLANDLVPVVTGFLGADSGGRFTTLGRNSSDYSGAIIAHVVDADELVIWTDVDGIYTANPHEDAQARLLHQLSYEEAHALAAAGAKVLHAKVLPLAAETEMVVWVRNTFNPGFRGTRIGPADNSAQQNILRGEA